MENKEDCPSSPTSQTVSRKHWLRRASTSSDLSPPSLGNQSGRCHDQRRLSLYEKVIEQRLRRGLPLHDARRGSVISTASNDEGPSSLGSTNTHSNHWTNQMHSVDPLDESVLWSRTSNRGSTCSDLIPRCKPVALGCLPLLDGLQEQHELATEQNRRRCSLAEQTRCVRFREGWKSARGTGTVVATSMEENEDSEIAGFHHTINSEGRQVESEMGKCCQPVRRESSSVATRIVNEAVKAAVDRHFQDVDEYNSSVKEAGDEPRTHATTSISENHQVISSYSSAIENQNQIERSSTSITCNEDVTQQPENIIEFTQEEQSLAEFGKNKGLPANPVVDDASAFYNDGVDEMNYSKVSASCESDTMVIPSTFSADDEESPLDSDLRLVMAGPIKWSRSDSDSAVSPRQKFDDSSTCADVMSPHARMLVCARDRLLLRRWTLADGLGVTRKDKASIRRNLVFLGTAQSEEVHQPVSSSDSKLIKGETASDNTRPGSDKTTRKFVPYNTENRDNCQELTTSGLATVFDSEKGVLVFDDVSQTWSQTLEENQNHSAGRQGPQRRFSCDVSSLLNLCKNS